MVVKIRESADRLTGRGNLAQQRLAFILFGRSASTKGTQTDCGTLP